MAYTVKQLAKLSGVSVRTLHWYDEKGLLTPAYVGANGYRYYEEEQLLLLQQILFFRELGFPLDEIKNLINRDDFDKVKALESHKQILATDIHRKKSLLITIDKTISHLRGKEKMKDEELYYGFDSEVQKEHEKYLVEQRIVTQEFMDECNEKVKHWSDKQKNEFIEGIEEIMQGLVLALENNLDLHDAKVQSLMDQHYIWLCRSWSPTKEKYLGLADLYQTPEFRTFYDKRHPDLLEFMIQVMQIYAEKNLE